MRDCGANTFGCSCTVSCKIEDDRKKREQTLQTLMAKRNAWTAVLMIAVVASICLAGASFGYALKNLDRQYEIAGRV